MKREILRIMTDNGAGKEPTPFYDIQITEYSLNPQRMGNPQLTATVMYAFCLDKKWTHREFVVLNGERYYIRQTPTSTIANTEAPLYKHEITFRTEREELLGNVYFYDTVYFRESLAGDKPVANSTTFSFYGNIREFIDRLNCALRYAGVGDSILKSKTTLSIDDKPVGDGYCAVFDPYGGYDGDITKEISVSDQYIINVISDSYQQYEIPYKYEGKRIVFGAFDEVINHVFKYGADNELMSITKSNANAKVINKISFKGSSENIPYYYPNETEYGHIIVKAASTNSIITDNIIELAKPNVLVAKTKQEAENPIELHFKESRTTILQSEFQPLRVVKTDDTDSSKIETNIKGLSGDINPSNWYKITRQDKSKDSALLEFDITFSLEEDMEVELADIQGIFWCNEVSGYNFKPMNILSSQMRAWLYDTYGNKEIFADKGIDGRVFKFGMLNGGTKYRITIQFYAYWREQNNSGVAYVGFKSASVGENISFVPSNKIYWKQGDTIFESSKQFGINLTITDARLEQAAKNKEKIYWTAVERMPFSENLMPPIYRETYGNERFYKALNDTYVDPDTKEPYKFPNPYIEGAPSEYIYVNEDIKPTIEGIKNSKGQLFGEIADIRYDDDDNDSLKADVDEDSDADSANYEHSFFYIKLNIFDGEYGFNLFESASQKDAMTLQMISGNCNGCKFKIQAYETTQDGVQVWQNPVQTLGENGDIVKGNYNDKINTSNIQSWQQNTKTHSIWICVQKDAETFGVIIPNQSNNYKPKIGDKFNIINIDLPQGYILAAERQGMEEAIRYMADNNEEKFTFDISVSRIFFGYHKDILSQIDENKKLQVEYNGQIYELYISGMTVSYKNGEPLPDVKINLTDTISVGQNFVQQVAERASSLIANAYTLGGVVGGGGGGLSTAMAEKRYLNKQRSDRTPFKLASDTGFEVGEFMSGNRGGIFYVDPESGESHIEVDQIRVRMKAIFEELMIQQTDTIGGELIVSAGGAIKISAVEPLASGNPSIWRCYFKASEGDSDIECKFTQGDFVMCKQSNLKSSASTISNQYYWLQVNEVNNEEYYVDLLHLQGFTVGGTPRVGDVVCQLGNNAEIMRQSAIVLSTTNEFAPCVTLYHGINECSLNNKAVIEYGVDKTSGTPQPFFNCYGRFFYGDKDKSSYIQFDPTEKKLTFKGELDILSTVSGTGQDLVGFVAKKVNDEFDDMEIGTRNILRNTGQSYTLEQYNVGVYRSDLKSVNSTYMLKQGQQYTIRAKATRSFEQTSPQIFISLRSTDESVSMTVSDENTDKDSGTTFTWENKDSYVYVRGLAYNESCTLSEIMLVKGAKMTSLWSAAPEDTDYMFNAMQDAQKEDTSISGGLILSSLIALGYKAQDGNFVVMAGLNGIYDEKKTGNGIVLWGGGNMIDAEDANENDIPATTVIRMDGTGYMAGNTIRFKESEVELGDALRLTDGSLSLMENGYERVRITNEQLPQDLTQISNSSGEINGDTYTSCNVYSNGVITSVGTSTANALFNKITIDGQKDDVVNLSFLVTIPNVQMNTSSFLRWYVDGVQQSPRTFIISGNNLACGFNLNVKLKSDTLSVQIEIDRGNVNASGSVSSVIATCVYSGTRQSVGANNTLLAKDGFVSAWGKTIVGAKDGLAVMLTERYGIQVTDNDIKLRIGSSTWRTLSVGNDNTLKLN